MELFGERHHLLVAIANAWTKGMEQPKARKGEGGWGVQ